MLLKQTRLLQGCGGTATGFRGVAKRRNQAAESCGAASWEMQLLPAIWQHFMPGSSNFRARPLAFLNTRMCITRLSTLCTASWEAGRGEQRAFCNVPAL